MVFLQSYLLVTHFNHSFTFVLFAFPSIPSVYVQQHFFHPKMKRPKIDENLNFYGSLEFLSFSTNLVEWLICVEYHVSSALYWGIKDGDDEAF